MEKRAIWGRTARRAGAEETICSSSEGSEEQSIALECWPAPGGKENSLEERDTAQHQGSPEDMEAAWIANHQKMLKWKVWKHWVFAYCKAPGDPFLWVLPFFPMLTKLGFFTALPAVPLPTKPLSEVPFSSPLPFGSITHAVCPFHMPWPFQSNPTTRIQTQKSFPWAPQALHLPLPPLLEQRKFWDRFGFGASLLPAPAVQRDAANGLPSPMAPFTSAQGTSVPGKAVSQLPPGKALFAITCTPAWVTQTGSALVGTATAASPFASPVNVCS